MWNIAMDPRECIGNNKVMTPGFNLKLPFTLAADNDQLEKNIMEFDQKKYDEVLNEFHKKIGLVFEGNVSRLLAGKLAQMMDGIGSKNKSIDLALL